MGKTIPTKTAKPPAAKLPLEVPLAVEEVILPPPIDTHRARRAVSRDAAIVQVLHTTHDEAVHLHDPIGSLEAKRIFVQAVMGLTDQMLLPILTSGQDVLESGDLTFRRDSEPIAPPSDRHASKLIRRRVQRRKQSYAAAVKTSIYGNYARSRASSRTESRFGESRFGGSRVLTSIRRVSNKMLIYGLNSGDECQINSSWIGSQQGSTDIASINASWLQGAASAKGPPPPSSTTSTARVAVDFVEMQRRADIERDLNTRESLRRSNDELHRRKDLRLKLRSLTDPAISLEKEEAMMAGMRTKGQRSRFQQSRQGTRSKTPLIALSPLNGKRVGTKGVNAAESAGNETTFRTEDYDGLASDVVLFSRHGELLVGENCFVVEQKLRQELLLDLQTRGVVQPRIHLVRTPRLDGEATSDENSPDASGQQLQFPSSPLRSMAVSTSDFEDQFGSFESTPILWLDLQATPLAKGVVLRLPDGLTARAVELKNRNAAPKPRSKKESILESVPNALLEKKLNALIKAPDPGKPPLATSQSESALRTQRALSVHTLTSSASSVQTTQTPTIPGGDSPVLPKHIHNGEKHLQSLRIRTPAYPNRLSRKTPSRGRQLIDDDCGFDDAQNLFSLRKHHSPTSSQSSMEYVREFPKPPQGRIQLHGSLTQDHNWKLPTPSPFLLATNVQQKR